MSSAKRDTSVFGKIKFTNISMLKEANGYYLTERIENPVTAILEG